MLETKKKIPHENKYTKIIRAIENGTKRPSLPSILMKGLNIVRKHGARSNPEMMIDFHFSKSCLQRKNSQKTFDLMVSAIITNVNLSDGSFTVGIQTQGDMATAIGRSQSTVSRHLADMIRNGWIEHACVGKNDPRDPKSGLACKDKIPLNNFYCITDKFPYLLGSKFGDEFSQAMLERQQKADCETGMTSKERRILARTVLHQATIASRVKGITKSTQKKKIQKISDRSRAVALLLAQLKKTGAIFDIPKNRLTHHINALLKYFGFGLSPT